MSKKSDERTVKDIDHTHPHHDEPFGTNGVYDRGKVGDDEEGDESEAPDSATDEVRTNGGRPRGPSRADAEWPRRVRDMDHTPPDDVGAQRTFDRGEEAVADRRAGGEASADRSDGDDGKTDEATDDVADGGGV